MALLAIAALGLSTAPARGQAVSDNGELLLGFRASAGAGSSKNYVVDLGPVSAFLTASTVQSIPLSGVATDLSSASFYGATWHSRTDLFWGVAGANGNFVSIGGEATGTLYATRVEPTNGVTATAWDRRYGGSQSTSTTLVESARSGFNFGTAATNASAIARTMTKSDSNSWSSFQPDSSIISFSTWNPTIEGNPSQYLDLFKVAPLASGASPALSTFVGRMVLESTGNLLFIPAAAIGVNVVQFSGATFSAAENNVGGVLSVTVTRTGDTSTATSLTLSTADGTAAADMDYTALTSQPVTFAATETSKTVDITIANRSGDQGSRSFTVSLGGNTGGTTLGSQATATGTITEAPSTLQLSALSYSANQEDASVNVTVTRTTGSSATTVQLSTVNGTAVAGTDFTGITNQVVNIPANINSVNVAITLSQPTAAQANKQFTVTLSTPGSGASLNSDTSLLTSTVNILATDAVAPTIALTSPALNAVITGTAGGSITVAGTASDNKGIATVEVSVDGGTTWASTTPSGASWSINNITPAGGLTTIMAKATDFRNNSTTVTRNFTYKINSALTVNVVGAGTVTGRLTGAVYEVGKTYTLTAVPGANQAFSLWAGAGLTAPATEVVKLSFVFTSALATTPIITATFVANPFLATSNVAGSYSGLVTAHSGTTASNSTNGCITVVQTGTAGAFTGTVKIDGVTFATPIKGVFDNAGVAKFGTTRTTTLSIPRTNKAPYVLAMTLNTGTKKIGGTLKELFRGTTAAQSDFIADRAAYSTTAPVAANLLNKAGTSGYYTAVLPARLAATASLAGISLADSEFPQGDGYTTITVSKSGDVTCSGVLGDGTAFTSSGKLSATNKTILFAQLYANKGGSIGGEVAVTRTTFVEVSGTGLFWFRPYQDVQHYPYGWPEGLLTDLKGSEYNVVPNTSVFPGLTGVVSPNTNVEFSDGLLSSLQSYNFNISAANAVTLTGTSLGVILAPATGIIGGAPTTFFNHNSTTKTAFKAIIVQKGSNAGGWGHFLTVAPKVINGLGESGHVSLDHN